MNIDKVIRLGKAASLILGDELILEIIEEMGSEWMAESYKAPTVELREKARDKLLALDAIKATLETLAANGRNAERE